MGELLAIITGTLFIIYIMKTPTPKFSPQAPPHLTPHVFPSTQPPPISYPTPSPLSSNSKNNPNVASAQSSSPLISFPPWQQHCYAAYEYTAANRDESSSLAFRQWRLAQSSWRDSAHPLRSQYEKELRETLPKHQEYTTINDGSRHTDKVLRPNYMDAIAAWLNPHLDAMNFRARPAPLDCTTHAVVMIEGRIDLRVEFVIRHTFYMLRTDPQPWGLIIFHSRDIAEKLTQSLQIYPGGAGEHIRLHLIDAERIDRDMANQLVMSPDWWQLIPVDTILLLQSDVLMMKPPASNPQLWHELTHNYVYVGGLLPQPGWTPAPAWDGFGHHVHTPFSGNGGCSIRQKTAHLELLRALTCAPHSVPPPGEINLKIGECTFHNRFPVTAGPDYTEDEDRWVGWRLWQHQHQFKGRIAFQKEQQQFAVDSMIYEDPFFTHKYWQTWQDWKFPTEEEGMRWLSKIKFYYQQDV